MTAGDASVFVDDLERIVVLMTCLDDVGRAADSTGSVPAGGRSTIPGREALD